MLFLFVFILFIYLFFLIYFNVFFCLFVCWLFFFVCLFVGCFFFFFFLARARENATSKRNILEIRNGKAVCYSRNKRPASLMRRNTMPLLHLETTVFEIDKNGITVWVYSFERKEQRNKVRSGSECRICVWVFVWSGCRNWMQERGLCMNKECFHGCAKSIYGLST